MENPTLKPVPKMGFFVDACSLVEVDSLDCVRTQGRAPKQKSKNVKKYLEVSYFLSIFATWFRRNP